MKLPVRVIAITQLAVCVVLSLSVCRPAGAQTKSIKHSSPLTVAEPQRAGVSPERLARIDAMCEDAIKFGSIPGVVALVARHGKIVYFKAFGMADNAAGRALKTDDIFRIASQTKAITATAVMTLWEEGRFQLDDPISKFIPEFKNPQVLKSYNEQDGTWTGEPAKREITIRDLLTHTSGLGYGFIDGDPRIKKIYAKAGIIEAFTTEHATIAENIKKLARLPLHHNPGERFTYAMGLDVLGYLIEIVSGMSFDAFLQKRLFEPLGMKDTGFYLPADKAYRLVAVQKPENGKWVRFPVTNYDPDYPIKGAKSFFSGGGGLCSTAKDYATFLQMYLNGGELGGLRILSRTTVRSIMGQQVAGELFGGTDSYYGLAFGVATEKGQTRGGNGSAGTFGWGGYFNTQYFADPKEGIIGVLMKQTQGGDDQTGWKFPQLVGQAVDE
jgi:CubicO group peptidase (beta-lactamase class C family)